MKYMMIVNDDEIYDDKEENYTLLLREIKKYT